MFRQLALIPLVLGLVAVQVPAPRAAQDTGQLGAIDFPTSQTGPAQDAFVRGVLLLHSFEYEDAREAFQEAQQAAPGFAMAYWGEAMTYNHPLWSQTAPEQARAALDRLAPTPAERLARAASDKERDWLKAVDLLFGEILPVLPAGA